MGSYFNFLWSPCSQDRLQAQIIDEALLQNLPWCSRKPKTAALGRLTRSSGILSGLPKKHLLWGVSQDYTFWTWVPQKIGGEFFGGGYSWEPRPLWCYRQLESLMESPLYPSAPIFPYSSLLRFSFPVFAVVV